jgi:dinuclear metal center YbgI/SA1388 family protein
MITLQSLEDHLNELLQPALFDDYAYNGIQIEGKKDIRSIACGVSADSATIQKAVEANADALIVHHGIFWKRDPLYLRGTKRDKCAHLIKNDVSLLGYHLPLDAHPYLGNNWKAAQDLLWESLEPFGDIGVKGSFAATPRDVFIKRLEEYYGHAAHVALGGKETIQSAALISGGAYNRINDAAREGIDCFVTGNFDEPAWHAANEEGINFCALGHAATEKIGPRALSQHIEKHLGIECIFIDTDNPF